VGEAQQTAARKAKDAAETAAPETTPQGAAPSPATERAVEPSRPVPDTATGSTTPATPAQPPTTFDALQVRFGDDLCHDLSRSSKKEWLITNGIGGYAMSTVIGLNTRRHHGLLVAARRGATGRSVVLSRIEEKLRLPGAERPLDTVFYPGVVHPKGYEYMESFALYPVPTFMYVGKRWRLEKRVALVQGENTVVVRYRLLPRNPKKDIPPPPKPGADPNAEV